jgi:hypothetical protein
MESPSNFRGDCYSWNRMLQRRLAIFALLLVATFSLATSSFGAKRPKPKAKPTTSGHLSPYKISQPKAVQNLGPREQGLFSRAQGEGKLLQETPVACACNVDVFYFCLYKKKGDSLESLRPLVEKTNHRVQTTACDINVACAKGFTNIYFHCD